MCGIAGLCAPGHEVPFGPWFADAVEQARHRGPDADGWWVPGMDAAEPLFTLADDPLTSTEVALGFLRLAILDLSPTGNQPMLSGDRLALAFNGEIYNYIELRAELAAMGYESRSTGDSEVILHAWDAWGFEALPRLEGMFAIALWDRERHGLLLARDRFGEKPLFWTRYAEGIAFASEVKQLAAMPNVALRLDPTRAAAFLVSGRPFDGASSWFEGIHQLEPGTWLWIDADGIKQGRYHDLAAEVALVEPATSPDDWAARFASALADSVRLRLRSDVPVGTSLSAGVDSSAVMAEATALGHVGYHSFTLGSDDPRIDERDEARAFAANMRSVWHEVVADAAGFAEVWDRLTWHQEAPVAGTSLYGQWRVQEAARAAGVIVMLDGQGADEVLGGYHKFFAAHVLRTASRRPWAAPVEGARFLRHVGGPRAVFRDGYRYLGRAGRAPELGPLLTVPLPNESAPSARAGGRRMRIADIERWSLPNLLTFADRNAMAHGVEMRLPFLAPGLVALALAMPEDVLVHDGWTKWPLRKALAARHGEVPAWRRGKRWFGVPQAAWLDGALAEPVRAWVDAPHPLWGSFADEAGLRAFARTWREHRGEPAWDDAAFLMVALDRFLRRFFPA
jgi:asparagine synthase (glutamine-hydrolysing)